VQGGKLYASFHPSVCLVTCFHLVTTECPVMNFIMWSQEGKDWYHLAQDRDKSWIPVNMVMNFKTASNVRNFLTT
jgi:hypothetical protein